jgi:HD superfamily phosphodiesterase
MKKYIADLHLLLEGDSIEEIRDEVKRIYGLCFPDSATPRFDRCFDDTIRLFTGQYEGYQACKTEYHDLRHTMEVLLATARMIHATILDGTAITAHLAELSLLAALMHDIGYIQPEGENGTGGQYTLVHVERSAEFFAWYGETLGLGADDIARCCCIIMTTSLSIALGSINFPDKETELGAKLVASADLIGQLADRIYLEKLLFLYQEFREAGVMEFENELDMLTNTCSFYSMVRQRIDEQFDGLDRSLPLHFKVRWGMERNLYAESIALNLQYLDQLVNEFRDEYRKRLKRGGIVERILRTEGVAEA